MLALQAGKLPRTRAVDAVHTPTTTILFVTVGSPVCLSMHLPLL